MSYHRRRAEATEFAAAKISSISCRSKPRSSLVPGGISTARISEAVIFFRSGHSVPCEPLAESAVTCRSLVRTPAWHAGGRGSESRRSLHPDMNRTSGGPSCVRRGVSQLVQRPRMVGVDVYSVREPALTKNIDGATVATATTSGIDAMSVVARVYAFAFGLATGCKAAALTGRAFRIFCAAQGCLRTLSFGGASFGVLRLGGTAGCNDAYNQSQDMRQR
jgi:hypothetical protein